MSGGSVEATLELWASSLRAVKGRIRPLFQQARMAALARHLVEQRRIEAALDQHAAEPHEAGALRHRLVDREAAKRAGTRRGRPVLRPACVSDRSCHVAISRVRTRASGGQAGSPLAAAYTSLSRASTGAQSISVASPSSVEPPPGRPAPGSASAS